LPNPTASSCATTAPTSGVRISGRPSATPKSTTFFVKGPWPGPVDGQPTADVSSRRTGSVGLADAPEFYKPARAMNAVFRVSGAEILDGDLPLGVGVWSTSANLNGKCSVDVVQ
jgi:hypothetical protein